MLYDKNYEIKCDYAKSCIITIKVLINESNSRNRVHSNLVSLTVCFLHGRIVAVFVRHKIGGLNVTSVGILAFSVENLLVQLDIVVVDGIIEGDRDHHRHILSGQIARNRGSIFRTEAVRQEANSRVTGWRTVRVVVDV